MSHLYRFPSILLASTSPRRRALVSRFSFPVLTCRPQGNEEPADSHEVPLDYVERMARLKAMSTSKIRGHEELVIGADTIVVSESLIFGKPSDANHAIDMLNSLRNKTHQVFTSIAIVLPGEKGLFLETSIVSVTMRDYSYNEIKSYVKTGDSMDKAGSYAIQDQRFHPVKEFNGCYNSVLGLPLCVLSSLLEKSGFITDKDECGSGVDAKDFIPSTFAGNEVSYECGSS